MAAASVEGLEGINLACYYFCSIRKHSLVKGTHTMKNPALISLLTIRRLGARGLAMMLALIAFRPEGVLAFDHEHVLLPIAAQSGASCGLVTVHNIRTSAKAGAEVRQKGVGWVMMNANKLYVLTPHHVATHASTLMIQCRAKFFPVRVQSYSANKDLALLTFEPSVHDVSGLTPVLWLNGRAQYSKVLSTLAHEQQEQMRSTNPDISQFSFTDLLQSGRVAGALLPRTGSENSPIVVSGSFTAFSKPTRVRLQRPDEGVLPTLQYPLIMEGIGIRPGFSGAPAYIQLPTPQAPNAPSPSLEQAMLSLQTTMLTERLSHLALPLVIVGMITKTETNGTNSAAISIEDLASTAKKLLSATGNIDETRQPGDQPDDLRFGYEIQATAHGETLLRTVSLVNPEGRAIKLRETCDTEYRHSSDLPLVTRTSKWLEASQALARDPSLDIASAYGLESDGDGLFSNSGSSELPAPGEESLRVARGGGDYGDGGGDADTRYTYLLESSAKDGLASRVAAFKTNNQCLSRGLRLDDGRDLSAIRVRGKIARMSSLSDLTALPQSDVFKYLTRLNEVGIFENSTALFCSRDEFSRNDTVFLETPSMFDRLVSLSDHTYRLIEKRGRRSEKPTGLFLKCANSDNQRGGPTSLTIGYSDRANRREAEWLSSVFKSEVFETGGGTGESRIQDSHKVSFRLTVPESGSPQGLAVVGNEERHCLIKLSEKNVWRENPWRYSIRDPRLEATIDLNSGRRILNLRITRLDRDCLLEASKKEVWLIKADFEMPTAKSDSSGRQE